MIGMRAILFNEVAVWVHQQDGRTLGHVELAQRQICAPCGWVTRTCSKYITPGPSRFSPFLGVSMTTRGYAISCHRFSSWKRLSSKKVALAVSCRG